MTTKADVDAVLVTRGTRGLGIILEGLREFRNIYVWDNSLRPNLKIFGRYAAVGTMCTSPLVYVQDDDVVLDDGSFEMLLSAWRPGSIALNFPKGNRRNYVDAHPGIALVGFGSVFEPQLVGKAFSKYLAKWPMDELFMRECDRVFTALNAWTAVDAPKRDMSWAGDSQSMEAEMRHGDDLAKIKERIATL